MDALVSVIIPVYNTEKYIERCVMSFLSGIYSNIEVICVNDGSTDNSLNVLERLHNLDKRVVVLNQPNAGVSKARNYGLSMCKGKMITFCDSDDWVASDYLSSLVRIMNLYSADIAISDFQRIGDGDIIHETCEKFEDRNVSKLDKNQILNNNTVKFYTWGRLFKREIIGNNRFNEGYSFGEDTIFNLSILYGISSLRVYYLNEKKYYYYIRETSIVKNINRSEIMNTTYAYLDKYYLFKKAGSQEFIIEHCLRILLNARYLEKYNPEKDRKKRCDAIIKLVWKYKDDLSKKKRIEYLLLTQTSHIKMCLCTLKIQ